MTNYLITGANRGVGLGLCEAVAKRGDTFIATCRKPSAELLALKGQVIDNIDITDTNAPQQVIQALGDQKIDILINNAGIAKQSRLSDHNTNGIIAQFEVNALAPLVFTQAMLPHLNSPAKIAFITSRMGSIADNSSGGRYGYRMSKAALNSAAKSISLDLKDQHIAVGILHPGHVKTDMTAHHGLINVETSSQLLLERIDQLTDANTGTFWHANGEVLPW